MRYAFPLSCNTVTLSLLFSLAIFAQPKIIFDTDFGGDADDLGALAMLNHFHQKKEAELLAVMCWSTEKHTISAIDAVNTFYGHPNILLGLREAEPYEAQWNYNKILVDSLPYDAYPSTVPEATELYRKILSEQEDKSITLVTVGPLMNIKRLLESKPDTYSKRSGKALVLAKIKEIVIMGGQFPKGERKEWNFDGGMLGVTQNVLAALQEIPVTYLGYEVGEDLKTGEVFNTLPKDAPLYLGFYHFSKYAPWTKDQFQGKIHNNSTFDQTAVLYAVRDGVGDYWSQSEPGICIPDPEGRNSWQPSPTAKHSYLILQKPIAEMEILLEQLMLGDF
ncbi:MAG: nucleoside hydrolase [Bacteroidota bacterium]